MQHSVQPGHRGRTLRLRFACRTEDGRDYAFDIPLFAGVVRSMCRSVWSIADRRAICDRAPLLLQFFSKATFTLLEVMSLQE